jgi:hypothetical protein
MNAEKRRFSLLHQRSSAFICVQKVFCKVIRIDVLTAQQADLLDTDDDEHLQFATLQSRVVFTQDEDFLHLHWEMKHNGIAYAHQRTPMRRIIEGLILIYEAMTEEEMENHVEFL